MFVIDFTGVKALTIPEGKASKVIRKSDGVVLWQKITSRIPAEYQEVEYVTKARSTKAYFDLGFSFDKGATVHLYYEKIETSYYIFGAAENSGILRCMISESGATSTTLSVYGSNGSKYLANSLATSLGEHKIVFTLKPGYLKAEDLVTSAISSTMTAQTAYTMESNLYLFAQNYNGSMRSDNSIRVRYFAYYDVNDELICELIPCYRKSDGEIGMYDTVRKMFLTNAGTGSFIKGADV